MSYQVLARKWRPSVFAELVGQEHVVSALTNALDNQRLHHAYLFTGTRGVGKTTIARIFSKSLNCEQGTSSRPCGQCGTCLEIEQGNYVDLLEIDAASRTKVEDTRELLDNVQYKPSRGQYKVYLIDEVHMLSKHSFNALLKTLEEPPPHVKFLLATTDPQKLPVTILSRCLQFNLKALSRDQIQGQLAHILGQEQTPFEKGALVQLAKAANGSMRDALSLTDQAIAQGNSQVLQPVVTEMLGLLDKSQVLKLAHALLNKDADNVMNLVEDMAFQGPDFGHVLAELMGVFHQVALTQFVPDACKLESDSAKGIYALAKSMPVEQVQLFYQLALQGRKDIGYATDGRSGFEMVMLRMLAFQAHTVPADAMATPPVNSQTQAGLNEELRQIEQQAESLRSPLPFEQNATQSATVEVPSVLSESPSVNPQAVQSFSQPGHTTHEGEKQSEAVETLTMQDREAHFADKSEATQSGSKAPPQGRQTSEHLSSNPSSTASLLALKQAIEGHSTQSGGSQEHVKKPEVEPGVRGATAELGNEGAIQNPQSSLVVEEGGARDHASEVLPHHSAETKTDHQPAPPQSAAALAPPWEVPHQEPPAFLDTLASVSAPTEQESSAHYEQLAPPWNIENSDHFTPVSFEKAAPVETTDAEFDPNAHLDEQLEVEVDFDVPAFLPKGDKVVAAHQLDTWSHMIESMPISALTKQLALHSAYKLDVDQVTLTLPSSKQHLNNESAFNQLQQALSKTLQHPIRLQVLVAEPKNTPFAVQQKINHVRQQHAVNVVKYDEHISLLRQTFSAEVVKDSIKPR